MNRLTRRKTSVKAALLRIPAAAGPPILLQTLHHGPRVDTATSHHLSCKAQEPESGGRAIGSLFSRLLTRSPTGFQLVVIENMVFDQFRALFGRICLTKAHIKPGHPFPSVCRPLRDYAL